MEISRGKNCCFLPIIIYKVLKLISYIYAFPVRFLPIIIYKVLKLREMNIVSSKSFLPIIIYKVLKRIYNPGTSAKCFLPIIIYKVLKPQICIFVITEPTCLTTAKLWLHFILQLNSGRCQ